MRSLIAYSRNPIEPTRGVLFFVFFRLDVVVVVCLFSLVFAGRKSTLDD